MSGEQEPQVVRHVAGEWKERKKKERKERQNAERKKKQKRRKKGKERKRKREKENGKRKVKGRHFFLVHDQKAQARQKDWESSNLTS